MAYNSCFAGSFEHATGHSRKLLLAAAMGALGCAAHPSPRPPVSQPSSPVVIVPTPRPTPRPADIRAELPLDQVPPRPRLPKATHDVSAPLPPIEAVQDFAQARIAMLDNERYTAINLLEKAAALDPGSFELNETLGQLYQGNATSDDRSIEAYERAAAIDPDHLDLQINLGRQYLASGKTSLGIRHLLLALQTTDYGQDEPAAAEVELFLSNALAQQGYARAAITLLERLSVRLSSPSMGMRRVRPCCFCCNIPRASRCRSARSNRSAGDISRRWEHTRKLCSDPANVEVQGRIIQTLTAMGRHEEATDRAADMVVQSGARAVVVFAARLAPRCRGRRGGGRSSGPALSTASQDSAVALCAARLAAHPGPQRGSGEGAG